MEQILASFLIAATLTQAADTPQESLSVPPTATLALALSTENTECQNLCKLGLRDLILGWDESARDYFNQAYEIDSTCALACAAKIFLGEDTQELRDELKTATEKSVLLPQEMFLVEILLKLANKEYEWSAKLLQERATRYRADKIAAVWSLLLRYSTNIPYHPETGETSTEHLKLISDANQVLQRYPNDSLVLYARAYIESAAPSISPTATEAIEKSSHALQDHPSVQYLQAHFLFRQGRYVDAAALFNQAAILCAKRGIDIHSSELWWKSRLYQVYSLACTKEKLPDAQKMAQILQSASGVDNTHSITPITVIRRWEFDTLPLRLLSAPQSKLSLETISRARRDKSATSKYIYTEEVKNCLASCLYARLYASQGKIKEAQKSLTLAEQAKERFDSSFERASHESLLLLTPWYRARESCVIAINLAKAKIYSSTRDMWLNNAMQACKQNYHLLPPTIITSPAK